MTVFSTSAIELQNTPHQTMAAQKAVLSSRVMATVNSLRRTKVAQSYKPLGRLSSELRAARERGPRFSEPEGMSPDLQLRGRGDVQASAFPAEGSEPRFAAPWRAAAAAYASPAHLGRRLTDLHAAVDSTGIRRRIATVRG